MAKPRRRGRVATCLSSRCGDTGVPTPCDRRCAPCRRPRALRRRPAGTASAWGGPGAPMPHSRHLFFTRRLGRQTPLMHPTYVGRSSAAVHTGSGGMLACSKGGAALGVASLAEADVTKCVESAAVHIEVRRQPGALDALPWAPRHALMAMAAWMADICAGPFPSHIVLPGSDTTYAHSSVPALVRVLVAVASPVRLCDRRRG